VRNASLTELNIEPAAQKELNSTAKEKKLVNVENSNVFGC
jgi:hypothetical protein